MNTKESMSIGKRLIEEMNNASCNAGIEAAAQIADKEAEQLLDRAEGAISKEYKAVILSGVATAKDIAIKIRSLKK